MGGRRKVQGEIKNEQSEKRKNKRVARSVLRARAVAVTWDGRWYTHLLRQRTVKRPKKKKEKVSKEVGWSINR